MSSGGSASENINVPIEKENIIKEWPQKVSILTFSEVPL